jgi:hypothetical protein
MTTLGATFKDLHEALIDLLENRQRLSMAGPLLTHAVSNNAAMVARALTGGLPSRTVV